MKKEGLKKALFFVLGTLIVASCFNLFFLSNNLAAFGVSGLSIAFKDLLELDPSLFILVANFILIIISFIFLGTNYTKKTIVGSLLFPLFIRATAFLPELIDLSETNLLAVAIVGGALTGFGSALIYKAGYGTGGTDITNQILCKYAKIPMGPAISIGDGFVVLIGGFVFGFEKMIYSLITLFIMSNVCDKFMLGISQNKTFYIISKKDKEIKEFLLAKLNNDVTILNAKGGKKNNKNKLLVSVVNQKKYFLLKQGIKSIDNHAFVAITDSYEVVNKNITIKKPAK